MEPTNKNLMNVSESSFKSRLSVRKRQAGPGLGLSVDSKSSLDHSFSKGGVLGVRSGSRDRGQVSTLGVWARF